MPVEIEFDKENKLITFTVTGNPKSEGFSEVMKSLYADPDYLHYTRNLWDMRDMDYTLSESAGIKKFASFLKGNRPERKGEPGKAAVVVSSKLAYGLSRMFEMSTDLPDLNIRVFESMEKAKNWLLEDSISD